MIERTRWKPSDEIARAAQWLEEADGLLIPREPAWVSTPACPISAAPKAPGEHIRRCEHRASALKKSVSRNVSPRTQLGVGLLRASVEPVSSNNPAPWLRHPAEMGCDEEQRLVRFHEQR